MRIPNPTLIQIFKALTHLIIKRNMFFKKYAFNQWKRMVISMHVVKKKKIQAQA